MSAYQPKLSLADSKCLTELLPLVRAYHEFEHVSQTDEERAAAIAPLLQGESLGKIWKIGVQNRLVGYIAVCFGYSIEFMGKDAFLDEFYIVEPWRGKGIGSAALSAVCQELKDMDVKALHLEVHRENLRAISLYSAQGFISRDRFHLMSRTLR